MDWKLYLIGYSETEGEARLFRKIGVMYRVFSLLSKQPDCTPAKNTLNGILSCLGLNNLGKQMTVEIKNGNVKFSFAHFSLMPQDGRSMASNFEKFCIIKFILL